MNISPVIQKGSLIKQIEEEDSPDQKPENLVVSYSNTDPKKEQQMTPIEVNNLEERL